MADMTVFKNIRSDLGSLSIFEIGNGFAGNRKTAAGIKRFINFGNDRPGFRIVPIMQGKVGQYPVIAPAAAVKAGNVACLLYTSPSPRDA